MAISSTSTIAQIEAEYMDTLSYRSPASVTLAHRHLNAINALIAKRPSSSAKGSNTYTLSTQELGNQAKRVLGWLERHDSDNLLPGPDVIDADLSLNYRTGI